MANQKKGGGITWTNATWNCLRGCSRVSPGCLNCYAENMAAIRLSKPGMAYHSLAVVKDGDATWTGKVEFVEKHLDDPLHWKAPLRIFVNSMSDLFHEKLEAAVIAKIYGVMAACPQHQFQVLTKRSERMRSLLSSPSFHVLVEAETSAALKRAGASGTFHHQFPLGNVWQGVSAENQPWAEKRIGDLVWTPAAVRWVSMEPLLDAIDLYNIKVNGKRVLNDLDWVVVGGESQKGCRPMSAGWARAIIGDCKSYGVPVFMKQLGGHPSAHKKMAEWPADLQVQEYPCTACDNAKNLAWPNQCSHCGRKAALVEKAAGPL